ncbi:hypothetical protein MHYP_G00173520 [Metynnis hypsauchen]
MLVRLQKYDTILTYTPGKYMFAADTLSCAAERNQEDDAELGVHIQAYVDMVIAPVSAEKTEQIRVQTNADDTMKALKKFIMDGWPSLKKDCPLSLHDYRMCRTDLTVVNDIIYKGKKYVIPASLRKEMLFKIHEGHLGEEKCKRSKQQTEPLVPHAIPSRPYYKVGADLLDFQGRSHIVVTDYYSNYPEVATLQTPSSKAVIAFMKSVFARPGVPCIVFTDNGPQFSSSEFQQFSKDFQHNTSSPNYPRSNGLAESSVKIVKRLMMVRKIL